MFAMTEKSTRIKILTAAEARFTQYGYGKTTMAEIARDCDMTAGNLYRHFENKLEIGAGIAAFYFDEEHRALEKIIDQSDVSAEQKLMEFVAYILQHCHGYFTKSPKVIELVQEMEVKSPCVCEQHQDRKIKLLTTLLQHAAHNQEFQIEDPVAIAAAIHVALISFQYPPMMAQYSLEELENNARTLCQLLVTGLRKIKG